MNLISEPLIGLMIVANFSVFIWLMVILLQKKDNDRPALTKTSDSTSISQAASAREQVSFLDQLKVGLGKTSQSLRQAFQSLGFQSASLNSELLEKIHEVLFRADLGVQTVDKLVREIEMRHKNQKELSIEEVFSSLKAASIALLPPKMPVFTYPEQGPLVILIVGVNGAGKTTTIAKLAHFFKSENKTVLLAAADTFRAAAIDQLKVWAERIQVPIVAHQQGADPAAVCFDAMQMAKQKKHDVLIVDTAGRLQNKQNLMDELSKIRRVLSRELPEAPHFTWLILDATTGQNAFSQVQTFKEVCQVSGIIVTKIDGTAKGGVIIGLCDRFNLAVPFIGVGEKMTDLQPFDPKDYLEGIFSI